MRGSVSVGKKLKYFGFSTALGSLLLLGACGGGSSSNPNPPPPPGPPAASNNPFWAQWGANPGHTGGISIAGQGLNRKLADIAYDPFVTQEQAEQGGGLVAHYQATLVDGSDFYMESKSGTYPSCTPAGDWVNGTACGPNAWDKLKWNVDRYTWESGSPVKIWTFASDWVPETNGDGLSGWEPVFHPVLANGFVYAPGAGGTVWKVNKDSGQSASHINPFPLWCVNAPAVDSAGIVYVNSEDGNVYTLPQGHAGVFTTPAQTIFLKQAIGAAYTPISAGPDGKVYSQNDGHLFVVGN